MESTESMLLAAGPDRGGAPVPAEPVAPEATGCLETREQRAGLSRGKPRVGAHAVDPETRFEGVEGAFLDRVGSPGRRAAFRL